MPDQTAATAARALDPFIRSMQRSHERLAARVATLEAAASAIDVAHLTHHVVRVQGDTRTTVAAFVDAADALTWADMLNGPDAWTRGADAPTPDVWHEVPGVDAPTEAELEPFLQQVRAAGNGTADA